MADEKPKSATGPKVSPARTVASLILLLIVGVICAIELRAGFGQMMSGKSMAAKSIDGEFTDLPLEEARGLLSLSPNERTEERGPDTYYHYEWYSLLRPLMGQQNPTLTIVASNGEKPMALAYFASDEPYAATSPFAKDSGAGAAPPGMMGGPGMGSGMGGGTGMGPGDGSGGGRGPSQRPPLEEDTEPAEGAAPADGGTPSESTPAAETPAKSETPAPETTSPGAAP